MRTNVKKKSMKKYEIINTDLSPRIEMKEFENIDIIIKNILNIGNESIEDLINLIIMKSNGNQISVFEFISILKFFWKDENLKKIINIFLLPFYIFNAEDELSKESYNYYCSFNIKEIIFNKLNIFELSSFYNNDDKNGLKISCKYNLEKIDKIQEINIVPIIFFIILYFPLTNLEKLKFMFIFFDYKNNGKLQYGKKKLFLLIRYLILISIFFPDIYFNYCIAELNQGNSNNTDQEYKHYNENNVTSKNKKNLLENINKSFWDFKKILFYIKNTKGVMKQLIQYMSKKLLCFEKLGQTIINKNEFIRSQKDNELPVINLNKIRSVFFDFIYNKLINLNKFLKEFDIWLNTIEKKTNNIKTDENIKSIISSELMSDKYSFDENIKEKLLNCCDKIFIYIKNSDKYKQNKKKSNNYNYLNKFNKIFLQKYKEMENKNIENEEKEENRIDEKEKNKFQKNGDIITNVNTNEFNVFKFEEEINYDVNDDMDENENSFLNSQENNIVLNQKNDKSIYEKGEKNITPILIVKNKDNNITYRSENEIEKEDSKVNNYLENNENSNSCHNNNYSNENIKQKKESELKNSRNNIINYNNDNNQTFSWNNPKLRNLDNNNDNINNNNTGTKINNLSQNKNKIKTNVLTRLNIFPQAQKDIFSNKNNANKEESNGEKSEENIDSESESYRIQINFNKYNFDNLKAQSPRQNKINHNEYFKQTENKNYNYINSEPNEHVNTEKSKDNSKPVNRKINQLPKVKKKHNFFAVNSLTQKIYNNQTILNTDQNINSYNTNTNFNHINKININPTKNNTYRSSLMSNSKLTLSNINHFKDFEPTYNISPFLKKYFEEFTSYENLNIDNVKSELKELNPKLFYDFIIKKFTPFLASYDYENIINILKGELSVDNLNLYLVLMNYYNRFLINKKECNQKIFFLNTNFYSQFKNISISQYDYKFYYNKILSIYEDDLFFENEFIFDIKNAIIIVPINANIYEKEFTFFKVENNSKNIIANKNIKLQDLDNLTEILKIFLQYANYLKNTKFSPPNYKIIFDNSIREYPSGKMINFYLAYYAYFLNINRNIAKISKKEGNRINGIIFKQIAEFFIKLGKFINNLKNKK